MVTFSSMFELAIELRDEGKLRESIHVFQTILNNYPARQKTHVVYTLLGGVYSDLREHDKAFINLKKATELNPKSELASLGLYVTLVKLDRDEEAIHECIRYLTNNPAGLYKGTLEELVEGLKKGYMTDYEDDILRLAKINGVES